LNPVALVPGCSIYNEKLAKRATPHPSVFQ
jgi:hypothetical protein